MTHWDMRKCTVGAHVSTHTNLPARSPCWQMFFQPGCRDAGRPSCTPRGSKDPIRAAEVLGLLHGPTHCSDSSVPKWRNGLCLLGLLETAALLCSTQWEGTCLLFFHPGWNSWLYFDTLTNGKEKTKQWNAMSCLPEQQPESDTREVAGTRREREDGKHRAIAAKVSIGLDQLKISWISLGSVVNHPPWYHLHLPGQSFAPWVSSAV